MDALGLLSVADSTLAWLLGAITIVVLVTRATVSPRTAPPAATSEPDGPPQPMGADDVAAVEAAISAQLKRFALGRFVRVVSASTPEGRLLRAGYGPVGRAAMLLGLAALASAALILHRAPPPVMLEVPITSKLVRAPVVATRAAPGRLVPAQGHFEASCTGGVGALTCDVEGLGERATIDLKPGVSAKFGAWSATWTHARTAANGTSWNLRWWLAPPGQQAKWYTFETESGKHTTAASLGVAITALRTQRSGPIAMGTVGGASAGNAVDGKSVTAPKAVVIGGPGLLPGGAGDLVMSSGGHARILLSRPGFVRWFALAATLLLLFGVLLAGALPSVAVLCGPSGPQILRSNRSQFKRALSVTDGLARSGARDVQ